ncbi:MAG TPA: CUAEP/CCAEP-tail radical SAM protein [Methylomirabilota bacterium]|nr:CUAEP/CCAEP-tail radical SAM protein [Methylomirabilota bacterium]
MRASGEILLIACYELGHQPLSIAWPAAFLERAGYRPAVLDLAVEPLDAEKIRRARLIAVSVPMHTALRIGVAASEEIRALNPGAQVTFYGHYAALNADELLLNGSADSVLAGEVEEQMVELVRRVDARGADAGATARGSDGGPVTPVLARLAFPVPARAALPALKKYAHLERGGQQELAAYVEASRGCKHMCRHCPIPPVYGGRFFVVPLETVLADVRQQVVAGARHVTFGDPDFLNGPRHALAVARAVHAEFPALTFDFTAKVEHLLRERAHLPELAALGCAFIVSAAESLDDRVLGYLAKGHTRADLVEAVRAVRGAGIALRPTWVAFTPWTTLEAYREWLDFLAAEGLVDHVDPVQYGIRLLVPPGSLLLELPEMRAHLGEKVAGGFHYRWTHPDPRMERLAEDVAAMVAAAAERNEDPAVTFEGVRALAASEAGAAPPRPLALPADRRRPPRLTEPWFC